MMGTLRFCERARGGETEERRAVGVRHGYGEDRMSAIHARSGAWLRARAAAAGFLGAVVHGGGGAGSGKEPGGVGWLHMRWVDGRAGARTYIQAYCIRTNRGARVLVLAQIRARRF